jgi:hypothetical protein
MSPIPDTATKKARVVNPKVDLIPVLVVNSRNTGIDNYPYSVERAGQLLQDYLTGMLEGGYAYHGAITRDVGSESREFYVFYACNPVAK